MGFILKDNNIYIHTKLTDIGRKKIAEGNFNPTKFKIGDSEIDYEYYKENEYLFEDSFILKPFDKNPELKHIIPNVSGDVTYNYNINEIITNEKIITKQLPVLGFFNGDIYGNSLKITSEYIKQPHLQINLAQLNTINKKTLIVTKTNEYGTIVNNIEIGDYILIGWRTQYNNNDDFKIGTINPNKPLPYIWYKILGVGGNIDLGTLELTLDKNLPNFGVSAIGISYCYVFPKLNSVEYYYNTIDIDQYWQEGFFDFTDTCNTSPRRPSIWNMDILYTDRIAGVKTNYIGNNKYPSSIYNGFLQYIKNDGYKYKNLGIIHFTNLFPENVFGDELIGNTFQLILPTIMWNQNIDNRIGVKFSSGIEEKNLGNITTNYFDLVDESNIIVGKIFSKLKVIIIEDQELLFAMSYKSNRNWTLPLQLNNFNIGFGC